MPNTLPTFLLLAATLASLTGCQKKDDKNGPAMVRGEWQLAVSGGGFTGQMLPVPAGQEHRLVFGPDSAYTRYDNGKLVESSTYRVRTQLSGSGGPDEQLLLLKTNVGGQLLYSTYHITLLTPNKLNFTTGGGCAMNSEYVRAKSTSASNSF